jgi:hypothetical protein
LCLVTQGGRVVVKLYFYDAATEKIIFAEEKMFYKFIRPFYIKIFKKFHVDLHFQAKVVNLLEGLVAIP